MNNDKILQIIRESFPGLSFSYVAFGIIDFDSSSYEGTVQHKQSGERELNEIFFDLASLTKPLTLASTYLIHPELFDHNLNLLLEHRSGLPSWGILSNHNWREQILSYPIKEKETEYSDFGALRLQLELEKKSGKGLRELCSKAWDQDIYFWKDLPRDITVAPTGHRGKGIISGQVHDPNAYTINEFCSHAGLFGTIEALMKTLINMNQQYDLLKKMGPLLNDLHGRFVRGWDTVENPDKTLAGKGCSLQTFGHLGFTGTSIWIDGEKKLGHVLLTNATESYWHDRNGLNNLRRQLGELAWRVRG